MKKGFTLVELLAVIVILAVILVIAVPQISKVIKQTKINGLASTAKLIAAKAEEKEIENDVLGNNETITCEDLVKLDSNYGTCTVTKNVSGKWVVTIEGANKFEGYSCTGTKSDMNCTERSSSEGQVVSYNCTPGTYLEAGHTNYCTTCPSNSYCPGGNYSYSDSLNQGIEPCASGTYSDMGSSVCYSSVVYTLSLNGEESQTQVGNTIPNDVTIYYIDTDAINAWDSGNPYPMGAIPYLRHELDSTGKILESSVAVEVIEYSGGGSGTYFTGYNSNYNSFPNNQIVDNALMHVINSSSSSGDCMSTMDYVDGVYTSISRCSRIDSEVNLTIELAGNGKVSVIGNNASCYVNSDGSSYCSAGSAINSGDDIGEGIYAFGSISMPEDGEEDYTEVKYPNNEAAQVFIKYPVEGPYTNATPKSVCTLYGDNLTCFEAASDAYDANKTNLQTLFSNGTCEVDQTYEGDGGETITHTFCEDGFWSCGVEDNGSVSCDALEANCFVNNTNNGYTNCGGPGE